MSEQDNNFNYKDGVTLKEYFEARLVAIEKATDLAAAVNDARLEGMNQFREELRHQATQFVTRTEMNLAHKVFEADIQMLRDAKSVAEGKASQNYVTMTLAISLLGLFCALIGLLLRFRW